MQALRVERLEPSLLLKLKVCEHHFTENSYSRPKELAQIRTLNRNAVPNRNFSGMQLKDHKAANIIWLRMNMFRCCINYDWLFFRLVVRK